MAYPSRQEALALLTWAHEKNPGPWLKHSLGVARAACRLAEELGIDPEKAYVCGLLHDIGRYEGPRGMRHVIAGHDLLMERGWDEPARICLTHSFPDKSIKSYIGPADVTPEDYSRIEAAINEGEFDDYDRLGQLCDAISWGEGVCLMEKRIVNVAMRYGFCDGLYEKWKAWFAIRDNINRRIGKSLYSLFPECAENTLDL